jgi:hypothetical protein
LSGDGQLPVHPFSLGFLPVMIFNTFVKDYLNSPQVAVQSIRESTWMGKPATMLVVVDTSQEVWHRFLSFDPDRDWILLGIESHNPNNPSSKGVIQCTYNVLDKESSVLLKGGSLRNDGGQQ